MESLLKLPFTLAATPPAGGDDHGGGEGFFATTIQDPTFWVAIAFLIFVALIVWKARGAITGGLDARSAKIATEIEEAKPSPRRRPC